MSAGLLRKQKHACRRIAELYIDTAATPTHALHRASDCRRLRAAMKKKDVDELKYVSAVMLGNMESDLDQSSFKTIEKLWIEAFPAAMQSQ